MTPKAEHAASTGRTLRRRPELESGRATGGNMRKIITAIAGLAIAAGVYFAGAAVQARHDGGAQQQLTGAVVSGQTIGIDAGTYSCQAQR